MNIDDQRRFCFYFVILKAITSGIIQHFLFRKVLSSNLFSDHHDVVPHIQKVCGLNLPITQAIIADCGRPFSSAEKPQVQRVQ